jgi:hypothetical protein
MTGKVFVGCMGLIIIIALVILMAGWTDSSLEYWVALIKGEYVDLPAWISYVFNFVLSGIALAFNIITEIMRYVL